MHDLLIAWPDGEARFFPENSPVLVGRSADAAVILTDPAISRRHLEFVWLGSCWIANDSSTHGCFDPIGVKLAPTWTVGAKVTVRLGGVGGTEIGLAVLDPSTRPEEQATPIASEPAAEALPKGDQRDDPASRAAQFPLASPSLAPMPEPSHSAAFEETHFQSPSTAGLAPASAVAPRASPSPAMARVASHDSGAAAAPDVLLKEHPTGNGFQATEPATPSFFDAPAAPGDEASSTPSIFEEMPTDSVGEIFNEHAAERVQPPGTPTPTLLPPNLPRSRGSILEPADAPEPPAAPNSENDGQNTEDTLLLTARALIDPSAESNNGGGPNVLDLAGPPDNGHNGNGQVENDYPSVPPASGNAPPMPPGSAAALAGTGFEGHAPSADPAALDAEATDPLDESWERFSVGLSTEPHAVRPAGARTLADTVVTDDTIQLSIDGQNHVFVPGVEISVGRDSSCLVTLDERHSLVSRHHLKIEHRDGHWWIDDQSSKGTYVDARRISSSYKVEGAFLAHLGDDDAGTPMRIITAGEHKVPRSFNFVLVLAVTALVLIAIALLANVLLGSRNSTPTSISTEVGAPAPAEATTAAADLARAKQATVLLLAEQGLGSGFFVTDNLIVTNQHVAILAESLTVAVSRNVDEPAEIEFAAQTVAVHPFLDIAVLRLTVDQAGNQVTSSGLEPVTIGDSGELTLGDPVYNTGFPVVLSLTGLDDMGDILLPAVSATSGEAANFSIWPGCSNPTRDEFIPIDSPPGVACAPDGDVNRAVVISTFSSGQGASGSPVFKDDAVVAVVFSGPEGNENAGRNIATAAFSNWLQGIIAQNS